MGCVVGDERNDQPRQEEAHDKKVLRGGRGGEVGGRGRRDEERQPHAQAQKNKAYSMVNIRRDEHRVSRQRRPPPRTYGTPGRASGHPRSRPGEPRRYRRVSATADSQRADTLTTITGHGPRGGPKTPMCRPHSSTPATPPSGCSPPPSQPHPPPSSTLHGRGTSRTATSSVDTALPTRSSVDAGTGASSEEGGHTRGVYVEGGGGRERKNTTPKHTPSHGRTRHRNVQGGPRRPNVVRQATAPRQWRPTAPGGVWREQIAQTVGARGGAVIPAPPQ